MKREVSSHHMEHWAVGWARADYTWKEKVMGREQQGQPPATKRRYLGTSDTVCARETAATRSTLQEKRRSVSSDMRHGAGTGGEEGGTHTLARGSGQASRSGFTSGSSLSFFPSRARGSLNTGGALERAERRGQLEAGPPIPGASVPPWISLKGLPGRWAELQGDLRALLWHQCLLCCREHQVHPA